MKGPAADDLRFVWHPFTRMGEYEAGEPVVIAEAEGAWLTDTEGRRYIDANSSLWVNLHGHRHPRLDEALRMQLARVAHTTLLGLANEPSARLARLLVEVAPEGLTRVFYSDSGSEAVEVALKLAFHYWKLRGEDRPLFVKLSRGYHGDTLGAVSVGGIPLFHEVYGPLLFETLSAPCPSCYRCEMGLEPSTCGMACAGALERILHEHRGRVAAVIMEPLIQMAGGMLTHPAGYLRRVREATRAADTLLILDEVATGFGRTGRLFACEHEEVSPDMMCLAKGITGGYLPLSATLVTEEIYEAFKRDDGVFYHGHSYTGNQLASAVAIASLSLLTEEGFFQRLAGKIEVLREELARLAGHPAVGEVRQRGFVAGVELVADRATKESFPPRERVGWRVCLAARRHRVMTRPLGDVLVVMPPYCVTEEEIGLIVSGLAEGIREVLG